MISEFTVLVIEIIQEIPTGKVATYKQISELAGKPGASRGVSWILHSCSTKYKLPWHRVINSQGKISFKKKSVHYRKQKKWLENEGVVFDAFDKIDLKKYQVREKQKPRQKAKQISEAAKNSKAKPSLFKSPHRGLV